MSSNKNAVKAASESSVEATDVERPSLRVRRRESDPNSKSPAECGSDVARPSLRVRR